MDYTFKDERIRDLLEDDKKLQRKHGIEAVKRRDLRFNEIDAAANLAELLQPGPGGWHVLDNRDGGSREGMIAGKLTGSVRLVLSSPDGPYGDCVEVEVAEVEDYHKG